MLTYKDFIIIALAVLVALIVFRQFENIWTNMVIKQYAKTKKENYKDEQNHNYW